MIDNGSNDGTGAYLAGVQDAAGVPVTVIANDRNVGFPAAINTEMLLDENGRRFAETWGTTTDRGQRVSLTPWSGTPENGNWKRPRMDTARQSRSRNLPSLQSAHGAKKSNVSRTDLHGWEPGTPLAQRSGAGQGSPSSDTQSDPCSIRVSSVAQKLRSKKATTSLIMLVKNEEDNLPACLVFVAGLFDEIVVVDMGSTDRTKEIAIEFGTRVFEFGWIDEFSAARNAAIEHATGDYAFSLDADDVVDPPEREKLQRLLDRLGQGDGEPTSDRYNRPYELGCFDDDDLAVGARLAGLELAAAHDLFVHHFGSRTFVGAAINTERLLDENGRRFAETWGTTTDRGQRVSLTPWSGTPENGNRKRPRMNTARQSRSRNLPSLQSAHGAKKSNVSRTDFHGWEPATPLAQRSGAGQGSPSSETQSDPCSIRVSSVAQNLRSKKVTTSLIMLLKNEEDNLPACLASVAGLFDEIVVVDTGSTDRTSA
jgi:glycosyltransferase involved in cell wall biosynthesis